MFLVDWCKNILASLSIWRKKGKILFLGLDNSGKTTLLKMLRDEQLTQYAPTQHPTSEELEIGNLTLTAFDLGGHQIARRVWKDYFAKVDAVVYLVDAVDRERFPEAKKELYALLSDEELKDVPFLILGNKIDRLDQSAASEDELSWSLGLGSSMDPRAYYIRTGKGRVKLDDGRRPLEVFMCSVARKMGYRDGFEWVCQYIS